MTAIAVERITVDQPGFTDSFGTRWTLQSHTGFRDGPGMRTTFVARALGPGSFDGPAFPDQRVYTFAGTAKAINQTERDRAYRTIRACLTKGQMAPLVFTDSLGALQAQVRKSDKPAVTLAGNTWVDFSFQFTAPDPRLIDVTRGRQIAPTQLAQAVSSGGVQLRGPDGTSGTQFRGPDGNSGVVYGQPGPSGIALLDNTDGTADADIVFAITGPCQSPKISTGAFALAYNGNLGPNDRLVIDTGAESVALNDANRRPSMTKADFFLIPAGETLAVRFTASEQNSQAQLSCAYYITHY